MKTKLSVYAFALAIMLFPSCHSMSADRKYEELVNSGISGESLLEAIKDFEKHNHRHFPSKVDIAACHMLKGEFELAREYFSRAEAVLGKTENSPMIQQKTGLLYGSLAQLALRKQDYDSALSYVEKALAVNTESRKNYAFLKAHILLADNKAEDALAQFDSSLMENPDAFAPHDARAYMYLLAMHSRHEDCIKIMEQYFDKWPYFPGLGLFASRVYEEHGDPGKAVLAAYLEHEYNSGIYKTEHGEFLKSMDDFFSRLPGHSGFDKKAIDSLKEAENSIMLVKSLYMTEAKAPPKKEGAFFVAEYIRLKLKIKNGQIDGQVFSDFLALEKYFNMFPEYYWNIWQLVLLLTPETKTDFLPLLEKIIRLAPDGIYAQEAWREISLAIGYSPK